MAKISNAKSIEFYPQKDLNSSYRPLKQALKEAESKIREDLFRFRTCCADPRASK